MEELGAIKPRPALQPNWVEAQDQTGKTYYYHTVNKVPCPCESTEEAKGDYCSKCQGTGRAAERTYDRPNSGKTYYRNANTLQKMWNGSPNWKAHVPVSFQEVQ